MDVWSELVVQNGVCGKDVIGEVVCVGELFVDMVVGIVYEEIVEDVRSFVCCCRNYLGCEWCILI